MSHHITITKSRQNTKSSRLDEKARVMLAMNVEACVSKDELERKVIRYRLWCVSNKST